MQSPSSLATRMSRCLALALLVAVSGCTDGDPGAVSEKAPAADPVAAIAADADDASPAPAASAAGEPSSGEEARRRLGAKTWTGDYDAMIERRVVRALVPWSHTFYYLEGANPRGIAAEILQQFEGWLNEKHGTGTLKIHVIAIPTRPDQLIHGLVEGRGDIALGGLTVTPERAERVDFSMPTASGIREWLVTGPTSPEVDGPEDLGGLEVHVRASSSYWESLAALNQQRAQQGLEAIKVIAADEALPTEDLLHMVHSGLLPATVADEHLVSYWTEIFNELEVHDDMPLREDGEIAWAYRKDSPQLAAAVNAFLAEHRQGTLLGNILINRYLKDTRRLHNPHANEDRQRFDALIHLFEEHAEAYDFETLLVVAQGYQESRLDQDRRSSRGAVGVMQLLPSTAADDAVGIPDISTADNNILAGVRYLKWIEDQYFDDPDVDELNRTLFSFASYNAGPNRIRRLRNEAESRGLDPNQWFYNVEIVAAEDIGSETVDYVSNIYKYYVAYTLSEVTRTTADRN